MPTVQTIHVCLLFKLFMYAYCSNYSCMPTVQTIHVCLLFKLFMYAYCSNHSCMPTVQTIHVCLLFKLFMYAYCSNYSCMPTVQTIHVCLLFKLFMSVRLRLLQYKLRLTKCTSKLIIWLGVAHLLLIFSVMFSFVCLPSSHRVLY
jgi:hypothetical protein